MLHVISDFIFRVNFAVITKTAGGKILIAAADCGVILHDFLLEQIDGKPGHLCKFAEVIDKNSKIGEVRPDHFFNEVKQSARVGAILEKAEPLQSRQLESINLLGVIVHIVADALDNSQNFRECLGCPDAVDRLVYKCQLTK